MQTAHHGPLSVAAGAFMFFHLVQADQRYVLAVYRTIQAGIHTAPTVAWAIISGIRAVELVLACTPACDSGSNAYRNEVDWGRAIGPSRTMPRHTTTEAGHMLPRTTTLQHCGLDQGDRACSRIWP
jgi:hypothetical protein